MLGEIATAMRNLQYCPVLVQGGPRILSTPVASCSKRIPLPNFREFG